MLTRFEIVNTARYSAKVWGPYVVTLLNWTPIFEWSMARLVVNNTHQNDTCYNDARLCAQNIHTNLGSIVNTTGRVHVIT